MKYVYIHIPFCDNICSYCDFTKLYYNEKYVLNYLEALKKEISTYEINEKLRTLYIGGGTPSCLNINQLNVLFDIIKIFKFEDNYEFTIECNVSDITEEKLKLFKKNKVNRLSIGIQTFNQDLIKYLNRNHDEEKTIKAIALAKKYINNINIDLIYAIPKQTVNDLINDLNKYLKLDINHISTYSLIIEPHTVLYNTKTNYVDDELDYKMYECICDCLEKNGYNHYEISNFTKKNYESIHNLNYWNNGNYYGFGLGASGYIYNRRYTNTKNIDEYIKGNYIFEENILSKKEQMEEEMFLGLRKMDGVDIKLFEKKYQKNINEVFDINNLVESKKLIIEDDKLKINKKFIYLSNDILINFIGDENE
ncbi:MAG: radical SAM family heme chaperone HemW [Bacilli bacterium]|nr:radical SAM family heme chaperone HemW [Bacilli bacterium]